jgi:hypothetical protein
MATVRATRKRILSHNVCLGGVPLLASGNIAAETITTGAETLPTTIAAPTGSHLRQLEVWEFVIRGGDVWAKPGAGAPEAAANEGELFLDGERIIRAADVDAEKWAFVNA